MVSTVVSVVGDELTNGGDVGQQKLIDVGVQEQAAAALSDLAHGDEDIQDAIIDENGLAPLLSLVRSGSPTGQEQTNPHNQSPLPMCYSPLVRPPATNPPVPIASAPCAIAPSPPGSNLCWLAHVL